VSTSSGSEYISQYYAASEDLPESHHRNISNSNQKRVVRRSDLSTIDKTIRRYLKQNRHALRDEEETTTNNTTYLQQQQQHDMVMSMGLSDSDDTTTTSSSEDTRPIIPDRINKPDVSLKNKILKTINKSLLSSELTGIDLNMLKFNDSIRKTLRKIERTNLERELSMDLVRSFSHGHLADLRREDLKYVNLMNNSNGSSQQQPQQGGPSTFYYTSEDVADLHMPRQLETYKIKMAVEKDKLNRSRFVLNKN
jgi:hypothetical protein